MDTNLTAHYMATQTSRTHLAAKAERGWNVEQTLAARPSGSSGSSLRRRIGTALIRGGERLQGVPRPAIATIGAEQAPASARTS